MYVQFEICQWWFSLDHLPHNLKYSLYQSTQHSTELAKFSWTELMGEILSTDLPVLQVIQYTKYKNLIIWFQGYFVTLLNIEYNLVADKTTKIYFNRKK